MVPLVFYPGRTRSGSDSVSFQHTYPTLAIQDYVTADSKRMALRYWIGLNAVDALLTGLAISLGATEANVLLNLLATSIGITGMLFVKTLMAISVGGVLWERRMFSTLSKLNFAMIAVVVYNMLVITYKL